VEKKKQSSEVFLMLLAFFGGLAIVTSLLGIYLVLSLATGELPR
jgi:hypothetical protein